MRRRSRSVRAKFLFCRLKAQPTKNGKRCEEPVAGIIQHHFSCQIPGRDWTFGKVQLVQDKLDVGGVDFTVWFIDCGKVHVVKRRIGDQLFGGDALPWGSDSECAGRGDKAMQGLVFIGSNGGYLQGPGQIHVCQ